MPSNHKTIPGRSQHEEYYDIIIVKSGTFSVYNYISNSPQGLFTVPSIRCVFVFRTTCYLCDSRISKVAS